MSDINHGIIQGVLTDNCKQNQYSIVITIKQTYASRDANSGQFTNKERHLSLEMPNKNNKLANYLTKDRFITAEYYLDGGVSQNGVPYLIAKVTNLTLGGMKNKQTTGGYSTYPSHTAPSAIDNRNEDYDNVDF